MGIDPFGSVKSLSAKTDHAAYVLRLLVFLHQREAFDLFFGTFAT
jgi:hypothetical protein